LAEKIEVAEAEMGTRDLSEKMPDRTAMMGRIIAAAMSYTDSTEACKNDNWIRKAGGCWRN
jgi:hypothetical protein